MDSLIENLRRRLAAGLPGERAQFLMAPSPRPRLEASPIGVEQLKQSAVLLYLFPYQENWRLVLMKRPDYAGAHGGQVSIPGGRLEPGENHRQAALREFAEETGISVSAGQMIGRLSELYIPASHYIVRPYVAYATDCPCFDPDPAEVEEIIELTIPRLLNDTTVKQGRARLSTSAWVKTPYFDVEGHMVWGATAMILSEFREVLRDL